MLGNTILPEDNELEISWLNRLAKANGFKSHIDLMLFYMRGNRHTNHIRYSTQVDDRMPFYELYNNLDTKLSAAEIFEKVTLINSIAPTLTNIHVFFIYNSAIYRCFGFTALF